MSQEPGPYGRLARWVLDRRRSVGLAAVLITVVSLFIGVPPDVDSNLLNLLPDDDPAVIALKSINEEEGGLNLLTISYRSEDPEALEAVMEDVVRGMLALDDVDFAVHEIDPALSTHIGLLQLHPSETAELIGRLRGALALGPALNPIVTQRLMDMGPITERIARMGDISFLKPPEGEGKVIVRPSRPAQDPKFSIGFMKQVEALLEEVDAEGRGVETLWMGGAYRHTVEDVKGIQEDILRTGVASSMLVLLVIVLTFRSFRAALFVFPPLIVANAVNLALVKLFAGALNTYTSFGTAILVGLGIDFAIHLVGRYREYVSQGLNREDAVVAAWDHTAPPCTTAALTSAAGFLALAVAQFKGFSQLGVLLASGLVLCLLAMLVLLPILLVTLDRESRPLLGTGGVSGASKSTYRLAPVGLMIAVIATGVVGASRLPQLSFEYDISALRRDGMSYDELSEQERALARESYSPVVVSFGDLATLRREQRRLDELLKRGELPHIGSMISIDNVLPEDQAQRNTLLRELVGQLEHRNLRYLPPVLVKRLLPLKGLEIETLQRSALPEPLLHLLGASNEARYRLLMLPKGNMWDVREASKLSRELRAQLPDGDIAGEYIGVAAMFRLILSDAPLVGALAFLMVVALAFIDLKRVHWVAGAVGALVAGMVWAGSMLQAMGIKLTMVNLAGVPILLGIGVDVVIHLLHRLREEGPGGVRRALRTTGVAAAISTLTTVLSFLSLTLAGNRGVRSLGLLVVVGLVVVTIGSVVLLPLAWAAGWRITGRAPSELVTEEGSSSPSES